MDAGGTSMGGELARWPGRTVARQTSMRRDHRVIPKGHITVRQLAKRLGISDGTIRAAFADGHLDGVHERGRVYLKDIGDDAFLHAMPHAVHECGLYDRWMNEYDIRAIGRRAVEETA